MLKLFKLLIELLKLLTLSKTFMKVLKALKLLTLLKTFSKMLTPSKTLSKVSIVLKTRFFYRVLARSCAEPHPSPTPRFIKPCRKIKIPLSANRQGYHSFERFFKKSPQRDYHSFQSHIYADVIVLEVPALFWLLRRYINLR